MTRFFFCLKSLMFLGALCLGSTSLYAQSSLLNFGLNDDSVSADFLIPSFRQDIWTQAGLYHHEIYGQRYQMGFLLSEPQWSFTQNYWIGVGGQAVYLDADGPDGAAIAVGGLLSLGLSQELRLKAQLSGFYAPKVIAFSGLDRYYDAQARLVMELLSNVSVYLGHRRIHAGFEFIRDRELDDATYVGAILRF